MLFPNEEKKGLLNCYLMDCYDGGLITKVAPMKKNRHLPLFVKAWGNLIYAIGGTADGFCERLDLYTKKWEYIAQHP